MNGNTINFILTFLLWAFILLTAFTSNKRLWAGAALSLVAIIMVIYPVDSIDAAKEGINLWIFVIIPSLLPFFILNDMMIALDVPQNISYLFSPLAKFLFNCSGYGAYAFVMSIFSGYPAGAKVTSSLIKSGKLTSQEGQRILSFSSTSGPLFIIGAVGSGMLKSAAAGYLLFISHILGAIINGIFYNILTPSNISKAKGSAKQNVSVPINPSQLLGSSIVSSLITCGYIGGYIILFCVIIKLLGKTGFFTYITSALELIPFISKTIASLFSLLIQGGLEISSGTSIISTSNFSINIKLILLSFVTGFGGLSILGQVSTVVSGTGIKIGKYTLFKLTQGIFSSIACILILNLNPLNSQVFSPSITSNFSFFDLWRVNLFELVLLILLILNISGYIAKKLLSKDI